MILKRTARPGRQPRHLRWTPPSRFKDNSGITQQNQGAKHYRATLTARDVTFASTALLLQMVEGTPSQGVAHDAAPTSLSGRNVNLSYIGFRRKKTPLRGRTRRAGVSYHIDHTHNSSRLSKPENMSPGNEVSPALSRELSADEDECVGVR